MTRTCFWVLAASVFSCQTLPGPGSFPGYQGRPAGAVFGIMTLNLHTWQEENAGLKLEKVADFLAASGLDAVALQECAQHEEASPLAPEAFRSFAPFQDPEEPLFETLGRAPGNAALLIRNRLKTVYHQEWSFVWSWSHMGFGVYQEGVAVLTRHKITGGGHKYVSSTEDQGEINARKVVWADIEAPGLGPVRVFSGHLSWAGDQLPQVRKFQILTQSLEKRTSFIAGDFNLGAGEPNYRALTQENHWRDDYFVANPDGFDDPTDGRRIDYVLTPEDTSLRPLSAQRYFLEDEDLGPRVSDHAAVIVWYANSAPR